MVGRSLSSQAAFSKKPVNEKLEDFVCQLEAVSVMLQKKSSDWQAKIGAEPADSRLARRLHVAQELLPKLEDYKSAVL